MYSAQISHVKVSYWDNCRERRREEERGKRKWDKREREGVKEGEGEWGQDGRLKLLVTSSKWSN